MYYLVEFNQKPRVRRSQIVEAYEKFAGRFEKKLPQFKLIGLYVGNVLAPIDCYAVNINDIVLLQCSLNNLTKITKHIGIDLNGSICNGDAGFDSKQNRKAIWNRGMIPNIPQNPRNRDTTKPKTGTPAIVQ